MSKNGTRESWFWEKVEPGAEGCWLWKGSRNHKGYGTFQAESKVVKAHRYAYELLVGPIPEGHQLDHLCRNRACVNPAHLEAITNRTNSRRGNTGSHNALKSHCPSGHPYDLQNTYFRNMPDGRVLRCCRECHRLREQARRERLKEPLCAP